MKAIISTPREIEISRIILELPVRYDEEDIPNDFPLRNGKLWRAVVDIDTGKIEDWPIGKDGSFYMKVVDEGVYTLLAADGSVVAKKEGDYVPHGIVPGEYGDYVDLDIDANGIIKNWPKQPDVSDFFSERE